MGGGGTYRRHQGGEEGEDCDGEGGPAGVDGQGHDEDHDEGHYCSGEKEAEHPVRGETDQAQYLVDLRGEGNCETVSTSFIFSLVPLSMF